MFPGMNPMGGGMPPMLPPGPPAPTNPLVGSSVPSQESMDGLNSPLLAALAAQMGGGMGGGQADPNLGLLELLELLQLGSAGVGGPDVQTQAGPNMGMMPPDMMM